VVGSGLAFFSLVNVQWWGNGLPHIECTQATVKRFGQTIKGKRGEGARGDEKASGCSWLCAALGGMQGARTGVVWRSTVCYKSSTL